MVGGYYYNLDKNTDNVDTFVDGALGLAAALQGSPLAGLLPPGLLNVTEEKTKSFALFGSVDFDITDQLTATMGRPLDHRRKNRCCPWTPIRLQWSAPHLQTKPALIISCRASRLIIKPQATCWFTPSIAKAVKTGGFNVVTTAGRIAPDERTYDPESSWNYELGVKTTFADGRANLNLAAFHSNWR